MRAGDLDRQITIEVPTETPNAIGEPIQSWAAFATVWAKVGPVRGRERFTADQVAAEADTTFRIRWLAGVTEKMRVSYDGRLYDITYIAELGRRDGLDLQTVMRRA